MHEFEIIMEILAIVAFVLAFLANNRARTLETEVSRLRAELNYLYEKTGFVFDPMVDERISALARQGRIIEAIKLYRGATGKGLRECKDIIEALARKPGVRR